MNRKQVVIIMSIIGLLSSCSGTENKNALKVFTTEKSMKLDSLFNSIQKEEKFNGNVLIAVNDSIILSKSYGYSDLDNAYKLNKFSSFRIASITKQFTAIAVLTLQKEKLLSISDPISKYIPELSKYSDISIENLISHTSGIYDYAELANVHWDKSKMMSNDDVLKLFEQHQPESYFKPNQDWAYSNTGYIILAILIERVSGQNYKDFIQERILNPSELKNTFFYESSEKIQTPTMTKSYVHLDGSDKLVDVNKLSQDHRYKYLDNTYGAGGLVSNTIDLFQWHKILSGNYLLSEEDKTLFYKNHKLNDGSYTSYGFGTFIVESKVTGKRSSHGGDWAGYNNMFDRHIDNNNIIILLQNIKSPNSLLPMNSIYQILYYPENLLNKNFQEYAGKYSIDNKANDIKEFLIKESKLVLNVNNTNPVLNKF